jgi:hypothetical protein
MQCSAYLPWEDEVVTCDILEYRSHPNKLVCFPRPGSKEITFIFYHFSPIFAENIALPIVGDSGPIDAHHISIEVHIRNICKNAGRSTSHQVQCHSQSPLRAEIILLVGEPKIERNDCSENSRKIYRQIYRQKS